MRYLNANNQLSEDLDFLYLDLFADLIPVSAEDEPEPWTDLLPPPRTRQGIERLSAPARVLVAAD